MKNWVFIVLMPLIFSSCSCSDDGGSGEEISEGLTPDFTPTESDTLANMVVNKFTEAGIDITVSPTYRDFNDDNGEIDKDDEIEELFTITNDSGEARSFNFQLYSVATGFSLMDEGKVNHGGWNEITVANGESVTFYIKFTAWLFGTQTAYLTITADIDGYIRLPVRAQVSGAADLRLIPSGYACADEEAPEVSSLDFTNVAYGGVYTHGVKLCNSGGEDVSIFSSEIVNATSDGTSSASGGNAYTDFIDTVTDEIETTFAFGAIPTTTSSFVEPTYLDYGKTLSNPASYFTASVHHSGDAVEDLLIVAGKILALDITYSPKLDVKASDDENCPSGKVCRYNPIAISAQLNLDTSLGPIEIPLVAATGGVEPMLAMLYKLSTDQEWRPIELAAQSPALYFDAVTLFLDWVSSNSATATVKIENVGTGNEPLEFYGGMPEGFFEYTWVDGESLSFPLSLPASASESFNIRYLPAAQAELSEDYETRYDFGHFSFSHTGGNGPLAKVYLVGEQKAGRAVTASLGGSELESEKSVHLCVFSTDANLPTQKTFTVGNNTTEDEMEVSFWVEYDTTQFTQISPSSGSFDLQPQTQSTDEISINFVANPAFLGASVGGTLHIDTNFKDKETAYASLLAGLEERNFSVPFQATANEDGESSLCGTGVLGDGDTSVTLVIDRITMVLADLKESAHNPPPYRFHLPLELNREEGTVRVAKEVGVQLDASEINPITSIRSYVHQATNIRGCAPLPVNPYKLEYEKGSWTGTGAECSANGDGTIAYTPPGATTITVDSDTACLPNNGAEVYTDANGVEWMVFYHDFVKFDDCEVQFYGRISTFAYKRNEESLAAVFKRAEKSPDESESFYEDLYGAYRFASEIVFLKDKTCNGIAYGPTSGVQRITDPDEVKGCYLSLAASSQNVRPYGMLNECSYFLFTIDEGVRPLDVDSANPDYDAWQGFGTYEPHIDEEGVTHETKYDVTMYNVHIQAYVIAAGDRSIFFSHPGHLLYSDMYVTLTTKAVAEGWYAENWQDLISPVTRDHVEDFQIYLTDGEWRGIKVFWTEEGHNSMFSNVIDDSALEFPGINYSGRGRGNFRYYNQDPTSQKIVFGGWPVNFDENNLTVWSGLGAFRGKGNTAASFAKADASTGQGKPLYFTFHGCLIPGEAAENQGCFDWKRDDGLMPDGVTAVLDEYVDTGILPDGYVDAAACTQFEDPGFRQSEEYLNNRYKYMPCVNYKILTFDRDRYKNYDDGAQTFIYEDDPYKGDHCGYGN